MTPPGLWKCFTRFLFYVNFSFKQKNKTKLLNKEFKEMTYSENKSCNPKLKILSTLMRPIGDTSFYPIS